MCTKGVGKLIRVEAMIKLSKDVTLNGNEIQTGFRITMKVDNRGYYTQLFSIDGENIPLERETNVYMDIVYGELEIEKFLSHSSFEFVSWKKLGVGQVIDVKEVCVETDAFKEVGMKRQREIMTIVKKINENSI